MRPAKYTFLTALVLLGLMAVPTCLWAQQLPPASGNEAQLIAVLKSDAELFDKAKACQRLAVIGTKESVPALAGLLANEELSHYARFGLEPIPDPSVDEALRAALGKLKGGLLVGVINSIGMRRDVQAVVLLGQLIGDSDAQVASAAAAALGRIHTPEAIEALVDAYGNYEALRPAIGAAGITAADMLLIEGKTDEAIEVYDAVREAEMPQHIVIAALEGGILARGAEGVPMMVDCLRARDPDEFAVGLATAQRLPGSEVTKALVEQLAKLMPTDAACGDLVVKSARYGAQDKWADVTEKVAAAVENGNLRIKAGNELGGDPLQGVVKELQVTYTLDGKELQVTAAEGSVLEIRSDSSACIRPGLVIEVLGARGDKAALPVILEIAKSGPGAVRLPAVRAMARLADATAVPVLLETAIAGQGALAQAARDGLARLPGEEVDSALATALGQRKGQQLAAVIELVGLRGIASAVPELQKLANSDDPPVRNAAIGALGLTIGLEELPALVDRLVQAETPEAATAAKETLRKACLRMPDREACAAKLIAPMAEAPVVAQSNLLGLLGVVGGQKALEAVSAAAKEGTGEVQDTATRVLGEWMSPDAAPVLLEMAKSGPDKYRVRALRGYIRVIRQLNLPTAEKLAMCRRAMETSTRNDEKKLVLEVLTRLPSPEALSQLTPHLANPALKDTAAAAAVRIAQKIVKDHPDVVAEAMPKVIEAVPGSDTAAAARALLDQAKR